MPSICAIFPAMKNNYSAQRQFFFGTRIYESFGVFDAKDARVEKSVILVRSHEVVPSFALLSFGQADV